MKSLADKASLLNALVRRRLEIESQVRMIDLSTSSQRVQALKREHARLVGRIKRLEGKLR